MVKLAGRVRAAIAFSFVVGCSSMAALDAGLHYSVRRFSN